MHAVKNLTVSFNDTDRQREKVKTLKTHGDVVTCADESSQAS